jgi:predicted small metal-binding protein
VPYSIQCRNLGGDCPAVFTTATKEELFKHVELHAKEVHPEADVKWEDIEQVIETTA